MLPRHLFILIVIIITVSFGAFAYGAEPVPLKNCLDTSAFQIEIMQRTPLTFVEDVPRTFDEMQVVFSQTGSMIYDFDHVIILSYTEPKTGYKNLLLIFAKGTCVIGSEFLLQHGA